MRSLRWRIALAGAALAALMVLAGGAGLAFYLQHIGEQRLRILASSQLQALAHGLEFEHGGIELHGLPEGGLGWALYRHDGTLLAGSAWPGMAPPGSKLAEPAVSRITTPDGQAGMRASGWFRPGEDDRTGGGEISATLVFSTADIDREQTGLLLSCLAASVLTASLAALLLAAVLRHMLRPHTDLAETIAGLEPQRRGQRIATATLPAELVPVAERINGLCDRLEQSYQLAATFHAAAAHELRNPLAGLRATIEVAAGPGGEPAAALTTCHQIVSQMEARVANLLLAARLDAGQVEVRRDEVDVNDLLVQAWGAQATRAADRGLEPLWDLQGPGIASADPEAVRMLLANLIDNAVSHADRPGAIRLHATTSGGWVTVEIANPSSLDSAGAARLIEHGRRCASTSSDARHAGLGMGICCGLAELLKGRFSVNADGRELRAVLTLPEAAEFAYW